MKFIWILILLAFALFLETSFVGLPFVLIAILLFGVLYKEVWIFPVAFVAGIFLDMLFFQTVGISSIFFIVMLGVMFLYQRKFEIQTLPFVLVASGISSLLYSLLIGSFSLWIVIFSCCLTPVIFWGITLFAHAHHSR